MVCSSQSKTALHTKLNYICLSSSFDSVLSNFSYFILHCILKQNTNDKTHFFILIHGAFTWKRLLKIKLVL